MRTRFQQKIDCKNGFESKFELTFSYPFAGIWEHLPRRLLLGTQRFGWPSMRHNLIFPQAPQFPHGVQFLLVWMEKRGWAKLCRVGLLSEGGLRLWVKTAARARLSCHKAKRRNRLKSKHKHWESLNFLISTGSSLGSTLRCREMEEQLSTRPLIIAVPLLLNPSKLPAARGWTVKGKNLIVVFQLTSCPSSPDGCFLWECFANKKVFFLELENTLLKTK